MPSVDITTGPIVACDNAIAHYQEAANAVQEEITRLDKALFAKRDELKVLRTKRAEWQAARETLRAE